MSQELQSVPSSDEEQINQFLNICQQSLHECVLAIDTNALSQAKDLIHAAEQTHGRLHVMGIGKPGHVASYVASLFSSIGTPCYELHGTECVHGSSGQVRPEDIVIAISNSGETKELKASVLCLKVNGVRIIGVTSNPDSWLAKEATVALIAGVKQEGDALNKPPRASILAEIIELQCLSILLQNTYGLTPQQYVKWHPGGSLGASITAAQQH